MIGRMLGYIGVICGAGFGATVGTWAQAPYPVSIIERNVLTPVVKPGDDVLVEIVADRRQRCDQIINRFVQQGLDRWPASRDLPSAYGRMGRDVYILRVHTSPDAKFGPAEVYSTGVAECNPYQKNFRPVESGDPWHDVFAFGPETKTLPPKNLDTREAAK